jgi:hypothetical protein
MSNLRLADLLPDWRCAQPLASGLAKRHGPRTPNFGKLCGSLAPGAALSFDRLLLPITFIPGSNFCWRKSPFPGPKSRPPWAAAPRMRRGSLDCNGSLLGRTCRARFVAGRAALDPKPTWARHAPCGAATRGKLPPLAWLTTRRRGVRLPRFFAQGNSQHSYTIDFDIKWPRPRRDMNKDPGWGFNRKVSRIDVVKLPEIRAVRSAVDVALHHTVQR